MKKRYNLNEIKIFFEKSSIEVISEWLINGFDNAKFSYFSLLREPDFTLQIQTLIESMDIDIQKKIYDAICLSLVLWKININRLSTLISLITLGACLKIPNILNLLFVYIDQDLKEKIVSRYGYTNYTETFATILGAIRVFPISENYYYLFSKLFFSDWFDLCFSSQLYLGMLEYRPETFIELFSELLSRKDRNPEFINITFLIGKTIEHLGLQYIADHIYLFSDSTLLNFLHYFCNGEFLLGEINYLFDDRGFSEELYLCAFNDSKILKIKNEDRLNRIQSFIYQIEKSEQKNSKDLLSYILD